MQMVSLDRSVCLPLIKTTIFKFMALNAILGCMTLTVGLLTIQLGFAVSSGVLFFVFIKAALATIKVYITQTMIHFR